MEVVPLAHALHTGRDSRGLQNVTPHLWTLLHARAIWIVLALPIVGLYFASLPAWLNSGLLLCIADCTLSRSPANLLLLHTRS